MLYTDKKPIKNTISNSLFHKVVFPTLQLHVKIPRTLTTHQNPNFTQAH